MNNFLTLLHSNYFNTTVTFSEQVFFQICYIFWGASIFRTVTSLRQSASQNSYFFRTQLLPSSYLLRISSSLGQVLSEHRLFGREIVKTFTEEVLFRSRYLWAASTFSEELLFVKANFSAIFRNSYFSSIATFLE